MTSLTAALGLLFFSAGAAAQLTRRQGLAAATGPVLMAGGAILVAVGPGASREIAVLVFAGLGVTSAAVAASVLAVPRSTPGATVDDLRAKAEEDVRD